jgi:hypothetical protein
MHPGTAMITGRRIVQREPDEDPYGALVGMEVSVTKPIPGNAPEGVLSTGLAVSHETAQDVLGIAIVCYTVLIEQEELRPTPDADRLAQWEHQIAVIATLRHTLDPHDADQLHRVVEEYADLVRKLDRMIEDR